MQVKTGVPNTCKVTLLTVGSKTGNSKEAFKEKGFAQVSTVFKNECFDVQVTSAHIYSSIDVKTSIGDLHFFK